MKFPAKIFRPTTTGFTTLEILMILGVVAILTVVVEMQYTRFKYRAYRTEATISLIEAHKLVESYLNDRGSFPNGTYVNGGFIPNELVSDAQPACVTSNFIGFSVNCSAQRYRITLVTSGPSTYYITAQSVPGRGLGNFFGADVLAIQNGTICQWRDVIASGITNVASGKDYSCLPSGSIISTSGGTGGGTTTTTAAPTTSTTTTKATTTTTAAPTTTTTTGKTSTTTGKTSTTTGQTSTTTGKTSTTTGKTSTTTTTTKASTTTTTTKASTTTTTTNAAAITTTTVPATVAASTDTSLYWGPCNGTPACDSCKHCLCVTSTNPTDALAATSQSDTPTNGDYTCLDPTVSNVSLYCTAVSNAGGGLLTSVCYPP